MESPIFDLAVSSMALAVFSRTQRYPPAATEASLKYHRLLRNMQVSITSLDGGSIDACLFAIFFMGRYEDAVHQPGHLNAENPLAMTVRSFSHHDGALAILKYWKHHLSQSQPATDVIKHTRRGLIRSALLRKLALPEWMQDGFAFGERGLELEYDRTFVRIFDVRHRLFTLLKGKDDPHNTPTELIDIAEELNEEIQDLDKALQEWTADFPSNWCYERHILPDPHPWPMRDFYSPIVYSYPSPAFAAVWNQYFATRMLINSTRLRILNLLHSTSTTFSHQQHLECLSQMQIMANDLASSVPFSLQRFKVTHSPRSPFSRKSITLNTKEDIKPYVAKLIIWPLSIVSSLEYVEAKQQSWFRSELARLGKISGYGVFDSAESDRWLEI